MTSKFSEAAKVSQDIVNKTDNGGLDAIILGVILCAMLWILVKSDGPNVKKSIPVIALTGILLVCSSLFSEYQGYLILIAVLVVLVGSYLIYGTQTSKKRLANARKRKRNN